MIYHVGAVLVQGRQIIATGYNGTPRGTPNCLEGGCKRCADKVGGLIKSGEDKDMCICVHAEVNAILQSAYQGTSTKGASMYTTTSPCMLCAKEMLNAGVQAVYYDKEDPGEQASLNFLKKFMKEIRQIV